MAWRDTITIRRQEDGSWEAKLHGYPFYYRGETAEECLSHAGSVMDLAANLKPQESP